MLANAKACMEIFMGNCRPTQAYQKQEPILNVGQCKGLHGNIFVSLQAHLGLSEVGSPFTTLANVKACI
jgi:hypothetical protein